MKINTDKVIQGVLILTMGGAIKVGYSLDKEVTRLGTILNRIAPLVDSTAKTTTENAIMVEELKERMHTLENKN